MNDYLYEIVFNELHNIQQRNGCWNLLSYTFVQIGLFAATLRLVAQISFKYISSSIAKIEITIYDKCRNFKIYGRRRAQKCVCSLFRSTWMGTLIWHFDSTLAVNYRVRLAVIVEN